MACPIDRALDPEEFRALGHQLVDLLADYYKESARAPCPVPDGWAQTWQPCAERCAQWREDFVGGGGCRFGGGDQNQPMRFPGGGDALSFFSRVIQDSSRLTRPTHVGHQLSAPYPLATLTTLLTATLNNSGAVYEVSGAANAAERILLTWMLQKVFFRGGKAGKGQRADSVEARHTQPNPDGVLVSGGSLGTLTCLLGMRQRQMEGSWRRGSVGAVGGEGAEEVAVLVSQEAHYCADRALRAMGLGDAHIVKVPCDGSARLDLEEAKRCYEEAVSPPEEGGSRRRVLALVVSAGSTSTGRFDDLEAAAAFCKERGIWLHVDAAHGGGCILSDELAETRLFPGLDQADSVVIDAHKMMGVPSFCTFCLFRDGRDCRGNFSFAQEAAYLSLPRDAGAEGPQAGGEGPGADRDAVYSAPGGSNPWTEDPVKKTLECTKPSLGLPLLSLLRVHGEDLLKRHVERLFALGASFADKVRALPQSFELGPPPDCNIVVWRLVLPAGGASAGAKGEEEEDALNAAVRDRLLRAGRFYVSKTAFKGRVFLRCSFMNPRTTEDLLDALLQEARRQAAMLLRAQQNDGGGGELGERLGGA